MTSVWFSHKREVVIYLAVDKGENKIVKSLLTKESVEINELINKYRDEEKQKYITKTKY